jgi:hypothetical protein
VDSNSLPLVPDLDVLPTPVRYLVLVVLVGGPLLFVVLLLVGTASTPTVVVEATVVDAPPADEDDVYALSRFPAESPVRVAVEEALRDGSASVEATTDEVRHDGVPVTDYYVEHDGRTVRVTVTRG